jgi:hypothetical protein
MKLATGLGMLDRAQSATDLKEIEGQLREAQKRFQQHLREHGCR